MFVERDTMDLLDYPFRIDRGLPETGSGARFFHVFFCDFRSEWSARTSRGTSRLADRAGPMRNPVNYNSVDNELFRLRRKERHDGVAVSFGPEGEHNAT